MGLKIWREELKAVFHRKLLLAVLHSLQDLSSSSREQTCALDSESAVLTTGPPGNSHHHQLFSTTGFDHTSYILVS